MAKKTAAEILAETLKVWMKSAPSLSSGPKLAKESGVSQKTINNIEKARLDPRISSVEKLAKAFSTEAYILMAPSDENLLPILKAYAQTDSRGRELLLSAADAVLQGGNGRIHKPRTGNE